MPVCVQAISFGIERFKGRKVKLFGIILNYKHMCAFNHLNQELNFNLFKADSRDWVEN